MAEQKKVYAKEKEDMVTEVEVTETEKMLEVAEETQESKEKEIARQSRARQESKKLDEWVPKTALGRQVKAGEITSLEQIFASGRRIMEAEVVDALIPDLSNDFILIGQMHGKFGGGRRRIIRQTQKKTAEGNKPKFTALAVVGNRNGYVGVGLGKAKESLPARDKALRAAKLSLMPIKRGSGDWSDAAGGEHSLPFKVEGKCGSIRLRLFPAPKGTGLVVDEELKKVLSLAGYKDMRSKSSGQTRQKINFIKACMQALGKTTKTKELRN
ncbi:MAG: 30S ribosomal protein S5 [DPANN group archaeon]|nr:30S ribosomal protein S5 [DPANN group archaeon]